MLERTTRAYIENIISKDLAYLQERELVALETKLRRTSRSSKLPAETDGGDGDACRPSDERNMTRKTRTRRPRIPAIQSGYCAVCSVPYNNVEDHIQSKKHQKLIGEDANYIALNGSLNGFLHTSSIPFLNLNGIDAIGVHETSLDDFSPKYRRKNMPRTRATSVVCDRVVKPSPLSPTGSDVTGHHLRSRRNINYMTPPLDDDSLPEKPDINLPIKQEIETVPREYKEYRELRSSTRALAKLTEQISDQQDEVWNSGRPKRACIKHKRVSADDRLVSDNKTYYKVEVMTSKLRSSSSRDLDSKRQRSRSPRHQDEKDKGLIVKFKKLRNSELVQLNNEATNFLFPKKDDDSSEDEDVDADGTNTTASFLGKDESKLISSDVEDSVKAPNKFKVEDEVSMDSTCSEGKRKKRRRTHAEAFIMDNEKYYKFETPGSRLRYQGTYLSSGVKSPKHNGECTLKMERNNRLEEPTQKVPRAGGKAKVVLDNYKFSFENIPVNAPWYKAFQRVDRGEQTYFAFSDEPFWNPFTLPYQMPSIAPLDPKVCMQNYHQIVKYLCNPPLDTESTECCSTPEASNASTPTICEPDLDEDSKMSVATVSSTCSLDEVKNLERKGRGRGAAQGGGKNPRKSPRQHASTLAILSSFIHQRKRRSRNRNLEESLPAIPEEDNVQPQQEQPQTSKKPKTPPRRSKPKIDYFAIARQIDEELDTALDDNLDDLEIEGENTVDFYHSKIDVNDIFRLYEEGKVKEDEKSCRRFFSGTPGRKPGRRRKKNLTGWPNKNRRSARKGHGKEKEEDNDDSTIDSVSVNMDSDDDEDSNSTDSVKKVSAVRDAICDRVEKRERAKVLTNKVTNGRNLQPYVCVQKLDSNKLLSRQCAGAPKRTPRRQRRKPRSPKSPRMLRRPRGRWYRER